MSKPMLIEALKPGMRATVQSMDVKRIDNAIVFECDSQPVWNTNILQSTDYEIIPDDPKPWEPSLDDRGWSLSAAGEPFEREDNYFRYGYSFRTKQAAEHKAKLDHIFTAILNMPGACEGPGACVYWGNPRFKAHQTPGYWAMEIPFDTLDNAEAAAKYANKLMEASHA